MIIEETCPQSARYERTGGLTRVIWTELTESPVAWKISIRNSKSEDWEELREVGTINRMITSTASARYWRIAGVNRDNFFIGKPIELACENVTL